MSLGVSTLSRHVPLSTRELAELSRSFRRAAREQGFSPRQADRYETWVLAFISWCWDHEPGRVGPDRIGAFQAALDASKDTEPHQVGEAMDALAFLFGTARDALAVLSATGLYDSVPSTEAGARDTNSEAGLRTVQVGWRGMPTEAIIEEGRSTDEQGEHAGSSSETDTDEATREGGASTAEICIQEYQYRLESLHAPEVNSDVRTADPTMRTPDAAG